MATKIKGFPYSAFLRGPNTVLPALANGDDVRLERRREEALVLSRADRFEARAYGMAILSRALADLVRMDEKLATRLLDGELPWLRWLPSDQRARATHDLVGDLAAGAETGTLEPFVRSAREWEHTAEAWSDPNVATRLQTEYMGDGPGIERPQHSR
ncbi:MAG: hypothetical protein ACREQM_02005 [Candidatus Dormibacteraceae bacterium]